MSEGKCKQIQLKLPFEPDAEPEAEVTVVPFDVRASKQIQAHSQGLTDIPKPVEEMPVRLCVGPDLSWLTGEKVS